MSKLKNFVLGVAIFLLTMFVGIYGINTFYKTAPDYEDFCPIFLGNETSCANVSGNWVRYNETVVPKPAGYCEYDYTTCQKNFDTESENYWKISFIIALIAGVIIIVVGALLFGLEFVGTGLMAGGLGIIIYGVGGFWQFAQNWLKFSLSLLGLIAIIYLAYRLNRKK